jgi:type II protein arginine methyltransferase
MLTTPITTAHFHSRILSLLSSHLSSWEESESEPSAPVIPPFKSVDTPLSPGDTVTQLIGYSSPWIDICSPDPLIANISRQVLIMEVAYAGFCGLGNIIIPGPRQYGNSPKTTIGLIQFARAIQEALTVGSYVQVAIQIPMYLCEEDQGKDLAGDLAPFARDTYSVPSQSPAENDTDLYGTWDAWNMIRNVCKYSPRLSVGKKSPL